MKGSSKANRVSRARQAWAFFYNCLNQAQTRSKLPEAWIKPKPEASYLKPESSPNPKQVTWNSSKLTNSGLFQLYSEVTIPCSITIVAWLWHPEQSLGQNNLNICTKWNLKKYQVCCLNRQLCYPLLVVGRPEVRKPEKIPGSYLCQVKENPRCLTIFANSKLSLFPLLPKTGSWQQFETFAKKICQHLKPLKSKIKTTVGLLKQTLIFLDQILFFVLRTAATAPCEPRCRKTFVMVNSG